MKSTLKAPGTKRLKLEHDEPVSNFAFKFNLRCYSTDPLSRRLWFADKLNEVGRCSLTLSYPH